MFLVCGHCHTVYVPLRRSARNRFCSRRCKNQSRVADGRAAVSARRSYLKVRYGLTPEQVAEMERRGCSICGTTDWTGRHGRPHIDHDHDTGRVRGILCHNCNLAIGHLKDDPELVERAAAYLRGDLIDLTP